MGTQSRLPISSLAPGVFAGSQMLSGGRAGSLLLSRGHEVHLLFQTLDFQQHPQHGHTQGMSPGRREPLQQLTA